MTVNQKRSDIFHRQLALLLHGDSIFNVVVSFTAGLKAFDKRCFLKA